jgi:hypothetical protein
VIPRLVLAGLAALLAVQTAIAAPEPVIRDPRFGINDAWRVAETADAAGAGWSRILFWWSEMQKRGPGDLDLFATGQDEHIDDEVRRGRELAGGLLNTPRWASSDGSPNGVPKNLDLPWDHPQNHWGQFVRKMAAHYKGRIDTWIIWNEVDIHEGQWKTWNGSPEEYAQLLKVAYRAAKAGNPRAKVVPYGAAYWYDQGATVKRILDALAADPEAKANDFFFDAANLHLYSRSRDIPTIVTWLRGQLEARGMSKPIWIGETNAIPYDDPVRPMSKANFRATLEEQAAYMIQAFATYVALDVERVSVNRSVDGTDFDAGGEPFGMVRNDGTPRPALKSFSLVSRYFSNATSATYHLPDERSGVMGVEILRPGERVVVAWTTDDRPQTADIFATRSRALRLDKFGRSRKVEARDGGYRVELPGATANSNEIDRYDFVVGGDPVILVERDDGDLDKALRPLDIAPRVARR